MKKVKIFILSLFDVFIYFLMVLGVISQFLVECSFLGYSFFF